MARTNNEEIGPPNASRLRLAVYRVFLVSILVVVTALALQSAAARLWARSKPDLALYVSSSDAIAMGRKANSTMLASARDPSRLSEMKQFALGALARDMTRDDALVALAASLRTKAEEPRARALVQQAERLSRRNLAAELWLIEDAVRRDDVPGALRHFDVALRTSRTAGGLLYPVLREALEDPQLTRPIARTLSAAPWRSQFLQYAVSLDRPSLALAAVVQQQRDLEPFQGTDLKGTLVGQLLARKSYDAAARLALGEPAGLVQDPGFANENGFPPFNWKLADSGGLTSLRLRQAGGSALQITAQSDAAGPAAVQLIRAAPGLYMFVATVSDSIPGLIAHLVCADTERELARISLESRTAVPITVPVGCAYQTLSIVALPSDSGTRSWQLTRVELLPIPASERK